MSISLSQVHIKIIRGKAIVYDGTMLDMLYTMTPDQILANDRVEVKEPGMDVRITNGENFVVALAES